ncbi:MAG: hypothetical protein GX847_09445, partial [Clostridiales bacterium]|nr:hypothetical protein [Clostridiales bacterium]
MEVRFSSDATREVANAARYYESEAEGLGKVFLQKLRESVSEIKSRQPVASA